MAEKEKEKEAPRLHKGKDIHHTTIIDGNGGSIVRQHGQYFHAVTHEHIPLDLVGEQFLTPTELKERQAKKAPAPDAKSGK